MEKGIPPDWAKNSIRKVRVYEKLISV